MLSRLIGLRSIRSALNSNYLYASELILNKYLFSSGEWVPPSDEDDLLWSERTEGQKSKKEVQYLDINKGEYLNLDELLGAVEMMNGTNIEVVDVEGVIHGVHSMIFSTFDSTRKMRNMCDIVVRNLKDRGLNQVPGSTGAEGYDGDDWMIVDTGEIVLHVMDEKTREQLDLENHWKSIKEGNDTNSGNYEDILEDEYVKHPTPVDWNPDTNK